MNSETVGHDTVIKLLDKYSDDHTEYSLILKEIRECRKKYEKRLKTLRQQMEEKGTKIITYMNENGHPGMKYKHLYFFAEKQSRRVPQNEKKQQIENILLRHQISRENPIYNELENLMEKKSYKSQPKLKVKNVK